MSKAVAKKLDTRAIEVAGRTWFTSQLLLRDIQVAVPTVDSGIDLIAYKEVGLAGIKALPLQLKCATERYFGLRKSYENRGILQVFIWNVLNDPQVFMVEYAECVEILGTRLKNKSWTEKGLWDETTVSVADRKALGQFFYRWENQSWLKQRILSEPTSR